MRRARDRNRIRWADDHVGDIVLNVICPEQ